MAEPTLLVLEDDPEMREMLVESLEDAGYFTKGASSADEALDMSKLFNFDLVVSDVRMAGSTDGLGALEALKRRMPELRCIVITGFTGEDAPVRAVKILVDDYLYKPFRLNELVSCVKRVLRTRQDKAGYTSMFGALLSAPRRLLEKAETARREAAAKALEAERERCVQGLFVGIRSNLLSRGAALDSWDQLDELDVRQGKLDELPVGTYQELIAGYKSLFDLLTARARSQSIGTHKNRQPGQVDRAAFGRLFDKIVAGTVSPQQLNVAGQAWRTALSGRHSNAELEKLHGALWN